MDRTPEHYLQPVGDSTKGQGRIGPPLGTVSLDIQPTAPGPNDPADEPDGGGSDDPTDGPDTLPDEVTYSPSNDPPHTEQDNPEVPSRLGRRDIPGEAPPNTNVCAISSYV